ncbi:isopenicillin N synthase family dioxygenase [Rhodopila sp.]|uniref:isopenicillin N synthase family dioxygenase n=1 Tax=Rhodopila sp. TaxID=2480087 RepID=UPI003D109B36
MSLAERIPVLDIANLVAGADGAREALAPAFARSCADTGFVVIANHGISRSLIDGAFAAASDFFDLEEQRKLALKVGDLNIGYLPHGAQIVRTSKVNHNTKPNLSESFYIVTDRSPDDPLIRSGDPLHGLNRWPTEMPLFRGHTMAYFHVMQPLAHKMVSVIATSLGLPPDYFVTDFREPTITLRLIRYPSHDAAEDNQFGFAPHIDTSFLTLLAQSALPGLEVRTREGEWIRPPAIPGTFVMNTGEMLSRYSNDRYIPTPHRVINANNALRHAVPFFYGPGLDAVIRPVSTCVGPDNPAKYEPLLYADHRRKLNLTNFDHRRKDADKAA